MLAVTGDLLPRQIVEREDKAILAAVFIGDTSRAFIEGWDGVRSRPGMGGSGSAPPGVGTAVSVRRQLQPAASGLVGDAARVTITYCTADHPQRTMPLLREGPIMKRMYEAPVVTDLGSVSEMTRGMGGAYGEFVQPGGLGMVMRMRMRQGMDED